MCEFSIQTYNRVATLAGMAGLAGFAGKYSPFYCTGWNGWKINLFFVNILIPKTILLKL